MAAPPPTQEYIATNYSVPTPPLIPNPPQYSPYDSGIGDDSFAFKSPESIFSRTYRKVSLRWQLFLDAVTPHVAARWTFSIAILVLFMLRIILAQGCPRIDPAFQSGNDNDFGDPSDPANGPMLPTRATDEFKPFIRRLPEFKFWLAGTITTVISLFLTLFEVFDLPVFWPILLLYFVVLLISTMRQQIKHMIKYGYVPWDKGKKKYGQSSEDSAKLFPSTV